MIKLSDDELEACVRAGIAAPSADNRHVVEFCQVGATLRLAVRPGTIEESAHRRFFHELAFGAIIENIVLAAGALRRSVRVHQDDPWTERGVIADFAFDAAPSHATADPLNTVIFARTTNRKLYAKRKRATSEALYEIARTASAGRDVRIHWIERTGDRSRLLHVVRRSEQERFVHKRLHEELFDAIRFDQGWHRSVEEGLSPGALEVEPVFRALFGGLRHWRIQRAANVVGAARMLGFRAAWLPAWTAPHLALVSVPSGTKDLIGAGRTLQRLWLAATINSLSFQPLGASVALTFVSSKEFGVDDRLGGFISGELASLANGRQVVMIARLGFASPPSVRSARRAVETYWGTGTG
jgi:hypothetical protein